MKTGGKIQSPLGALKMESKGFLNSNKKIGSPPPPERNHNSHSKQKHAQTFDQTVSPNRKSKPPPRIHHSNDSGKVTKK